MSTRVRSARTHTHVSVVGEVKGERAVRSKKESKQIVCIGVWLCTKLQNNRSTRGDQRDDERRRGNEDDNKKDVPATENSKKFKTETETSRLR